MRRQKSQQRTMHADFNIRITASAEPEKQAGFLDAGRRHGGQEALNVRRYQLNSRKHSSGGRKPSVSGVKNSRTYRKAVIIKFSDRQSGIILCSGVRESSSKNLMEN